MAIWLLSSVPNLMLEVAFCCPLESSEAVSFKQYEADGIILWDCFLGGLWMLEASYVHALDVSTSCLDRAGGLGMPALAM